MQQVSISNCPCGLDSMGDNSTDTVPTLVVTIGAVVVVFSHGSNNTQILVSALSLENLAQEIVMAARRMSRSYGNAKTLGKSD
jgi:phosphate/sulfate permease